MFSLSFTFQILPTAPKPRGMTGVTLRKWHPAPTVRCKPVPKPAASPAPWAAAPAPASYCGGRAPAAPAANAQPAWMRDDPPAATQRVYDPWQDEEDTKTTQVSVGALVKLMIGSGNMCRYEFGNCILTNILMYFVVWWHAIFKWKELWFWAWWVATRDIQWKGFSCRALQVPYPSSSETRLPSADAAAEGEGEEFECWFGWFKMLRWIPIRVRATVRKCSIKWCFFAPLQNP